jgi:neutral ceramidase
MPVELANGVIGYVPTEEALGPRGGGYETRLTAYSNLEVTAGTQIVKAGIQLARQMKPGAIPEPRRVPPSTSPWEYGSVPPELA